MRLFLLWLLFGEKGTDRIEGFEYHAESLAEETQKHIDAGACVAKKITEIGTAEAETETGRFVDLVVEND